MAYTIGEYIRVIGYKNITNVFKYRSGKMNREKGIYKQLQREMSWKMEKNKVQIENSQSAKHSVYSLIHTYNFSSWESGFFEAGLTSDFGCILIKVFCAYFPP